MQRYAYIRTMFHSIIIETNYFRDNEVFWTLCCMKRLFCAPILHRNCLIIRNFSHFFWIKIKRNPLTILQSLRGVILTTHFFHRQIRLYETKFRIRFYSETRMMQFDD